MNGINMDINAAREMIRDRADEGLECPCCRQFVKIYQRKLYSSIAYALICLYKNHPHSEYIHLNDLTLKDPIMAGSGGRGDFAKLAHWNLIEEKTKSENDDKRNSGYWKITENGILFVERKIRVPSHVKIYNGKMIGHSGACIGIDECLGNRFSYYNLMGFQFNGSGMKDYKDIDQLDMFK